MKVAKKYADVTLGDRENLWSVISLPVHHKNLGSIPEWVNLLGDYSLMYSTQCIQDTLKAMHTMCNSL